MSKYLADRLAEYAHSLSYSDLSESAVEEAKKRVVDSLGCAIGAFREKPVRAARSLAESAYPGGAATMLGTRKKTTVDVATFVNGLMVRYFDYNDTYLSKEPGHPSDNIPACLACAEMEGRSGRDVIVAVALAYEVQCRLCDAADIRHRGWDHVCYGLVSGALASGKLLGLSKDQLAQAVNISLNSHIAMRQVRAGALSMWKGFSFANASRNAVFSALLAREGITGPSPIFEGEMGFFRQVSGPFELDVGSFGRRRSRFKLEDTFLKFYPAEYHAQSAVKAALDLREKIGRSDEIDSVEVATHEAGYTILGKDRQKWAPETRETADHSMPYMVGMALLEGRVDNRTYSERKVRDPGARRFMEKVSVIEDEALTAIYPSSIANRVTVKLKDGRVIAEQVNDPRGHPKNPMTGEEVGRKFMTLTSGLLPRSRALKVLEVVGTLETQRDLKALFRACVVG